jgi:hypothetical protein
LFLSVVGASGQQRATLAVNLESHGKLIPSDFAGFSIEVGDAAEKYLGPAGRPNEVFYQLLRNLGSGTMRIGGNSTDRSCWDPKDAPKPALCRFAISRPDVAGFAQASAATGWGMIIGVNLAQNSAEWALPYGDAVVKAFQETPDSRLLAFEFGNEPDLYPHHIASDNLQLRGSFYSVRGLVKDWKPYVAAFKENPVTASVPLAGPAFAGVNKQFPAGSSLAAWIRGVGAKNLAVVTLHHYMLSGCRGKFVSIPQLLDPDLMAVYAARAARWVKTAHRYGLSVELAETNSISCGGRNGISNTFAATAWGLDWLFANFSLGMRRVNFHMSGGAPYSAVHVVTHISDHSAVEYSNTVEPLYYAIYAFSRLAEGGELLPVKFKSKASVSAYVVRNPKDGSARVFLINENPKGAADILLHFSGRMGAASRLLIRAPALNSADAAYGGVRFDDATGHLSGTPDVKPIPEDGNGDYHVSLPVASVAVVMVRRAG